MTQPAKTLKPTSPLLQKITFPAVAVILLLGIGYGKEEQADHNKDAGTDQVVVEEINICPGELPEEETELQKNYHEYMEFYKANMKIAFRIRDESSELIQQKTNRDYLEQIEARLNQAVAEGRLTSEEAKAKLDLLQKASAAFCEMENQQNAQDERLKEIWDKMMVRVKAGTMTLGEARNKMKKIKELAQQEMHRAYMDQVKDGTMTLSEALYKIKMLKVQANQEMYHEYLKQIEVCLDEAVAAGRLTSQEAQVKLEQYKNEVLHYIEHENQPEFEIRLQAVINRLQEKQKTSQKVGLQH